MKTWQKLKNDPGLWPQYFIREKILESTRDFFKTRKFHEVETPILLANPAAESYIDVFETTLYDRHRKARKMYLSTSPETSLKKLLVAGIGDCYALTKSFRNMETHSSLHNPEFTILEWYRKGADYLDVMRDCENLILELHHKINKTSENLLNYQGKSVDLSAPWQRLTMNEAFAKFAGFNLSEALDLKSLTNFARQKGYKIEASTTWEELYNQIYLNEIEPNLGMGKPTIIYDFPVAVAALAKVKDSDPRWAERFEFYIAGLELGDAYSELTDAGEQEARFKSEITQIVKSGKTQYDYDHDFIDALKSGLPKCSGVAVGLDRIVMLLSDAKSIAEILFFPLSELISD